MKKLFLATSAALAVAALCAVRINGQTGDTPPPWAYPQAPQGQQRPPDDGKVYHLEGSTAGFTATQINDPFTPPDWYPNEHPPMPDVVAHGRKPDLRACGQCHMPHGLGHPESSGLAGLPADYIVEQLHAYRDGRRKSSVGNTIMIPLSKAATEEEMRTAAEYYSSVKPQKWLRVVETDMAPTTFVGVGNMRFATTDGKKEPLGQRVIELPEDAEKAELRDGHAGFVAYVPKGSIAKGEELATTGGDHVENGRIVKGKTTACGVCHGAQLKGLGNVPNLAGRSPIYLVRQLYDFKHGARTGKEAALMIPVVVGLTQDDMVNLAAYISSRQP
jgi:cytochrome c553